MTPAFAYYDLIDKATPGTFIRVKEEIRAFSESLPAGTLVRLESKLPNFSPGWSAIAELDGRIVPIVINPHHYTSFRLLGTWK